MEQEFLQKMGDLTDAINRLVELIRPPEKLLKQCEVAELLGVADSTILNMVRRGQIKAVTGVGKTLKFRQSDINKLINKN